jgi:hypothetical protein
MFEKYLHPIPEYSPNTPASLLLMPTDPLDALLGRPSNSRSYSVPQPDVGFPSQQSLTKYLGDAENERWQTTKEVMGYLKSALSLSKGQSGRPSNTSYWINDGKQLPHIDDFQRPSRVEKN